jgi:hypothetical protein
MRKLIPYAGYDPFERRPERALDFKLKVAQAFRDGLDTETIARCMFVRESIVANALAFRRSVGL